MNEILFTLIGGTILILILVGFIIYLVIFANRSFRRGVEWGERNSKVEEHYKQFIKDKWLEGVYKSWENDLKNQ